MLIGSSWSRVKWLLFYILAANTSLPPFPLPAANQLGDTWGPSLAAVHSKTMGAANEDRLSQNHQQHTRLGCHNNIQLYLDTPLHTLTVVQEQLLTILFLGGEIFAVNLPEADTELKS